MGHQNGGPPQRLEPLEDALCPLGVHAGEGLVQQKHRPLQGQASGQSQPPGRAFP